MSPVVDKLLHMKFFGRIMFPFVLIYLFQMCSDPERTMIGTWNIRKIIDGDSITNFEGQNHLYINDSMVYTDQYKVLQSVRWTLKKDFLQLVHCHLECDTLLFDLSFSSKNEMIWRQRDAPERFELFLSKEWSGHGSEGYSIWIYVAMTCC